MSVNNFYGMAVDSQEANEKGAYKCLARSSSPFCKTGEALCELLLMLLIFATAFREMTEK